MDTRVMQHVAAQIKYFFIMGKDNNTEAENKQGTKICEGEREWLFL